MTTTVRLRFVRLTLDNGSRGHDRPVISMATPYRWFQQRHHKGGSNGRNINIVQMLQGAGLRRDRWHKATKTGPATLMSLRLCVVSSTSNIRVTSQRRGQEDGAGEEKRQKTKEGQEDREIRTWKRQSRENWRSMVEDTERVRWAKYRKRRYSTFKSGGTESFDDAVLAPAHHLPSWNNK